MFVDKKITLKGNCLTHQLGEVYKRDSLDKDYNCVLPRIFADLSFQLLQQLR